MAEYIPFSEDDKLRASSVDLVSFLQSRGEQLKRLGHDYKLIYTDGGGVHDSIMIRGNRWYDHKNQVGGGPVKFMRDFYGMSYPDAMIALLGGYTNSRVSPSKAPIKLAPKKESERKPFTLPEANDNMRRAYAYLTKQRFIAPEVISFFAHKGTIYEDKAHHNVVFVGTDENGVPKQAHARSTLSFGSTFRITIEGSDTKYSFAHFGKNDTLYVFEAPIDMLSYITLHPQGWQDNSYIAMNGVYESAVLAFQVPEELFQQIKDYLNRHNMTQKEFVIGLITTELERDMALRNSVTEEQATPEEDEEDAESEDEGLDDEESEDEDIDEDEYEEESEDEGFDEDEESEDEDETESEDESMSLGM